MNAREWLERNCGERLGEFVWHLIKAAPWIAVITLIVYGLEASGMLKGFDAEALDTFLRVHGRVGSNNVAIVEIGEKDYASEFRSKSPLCRDHLLQLIANVRSYSPAAIGVDIDTSDAVGASDSRERCDADSDSTPPLANLAESRMSPIIWAEVPRDAANEMELTQVLSERPKPADEHSSEPRGKGKKKEKEGTEATPDTSQAPVSMLTELLSAQPHANPLVARDFVGIPRFPVDSDGTVRQYESRFEVNGSLESANTNDSSKSVLPSLARALVEASDLCANPAPKDTTGAQLKCPIAAESKEPVYFNFYGDRYRFPIIDAGQFDEPYDKFKQENPETADTRKSLLQNRIVLIGGTYAAARDLYFTPLGPMAGVELNALAVQSDLSGGGIGKAQELTMIACDVIFGILVVWVFYVWPNRPWRALAVSLLGLSFVAVVVSRELFATASYFLNFMPIIIGITLHQSIELAGQAGELRQELEETKLESQRLVGENKGLHDQLKLANLLWESREHDREKGQETKLAVKSKARSVGAD